MPDNYTPIEETVKIAWYNLHTNDKDEKTQVWDELCHHLELDVDNIEPIDIVVKPIDIEDNDIVFHVEGEYLDNSK